MWHLLPIPTKDSIPPFSGAEPLTNMLDREYKRWYEETIGIDRLKEPVRAPDAFLNVFGEMLAADLQDADDDRTKRVKIYLAEDTNRRRGMWLTVKPIIDSICGGDAKFSYSMLGGGTDFMGLVGSEDASDPDSYDKLVYMFMSGNSADVRGFRIVGSDEDDGGSAQVEVGTYLIDVDNSTLTYQQVEDLKLSLQGQICAYFRVVLGYSQGTDFIQYGNGEIHGI